MLQIPTLHFITDTQATQDLKRPKGKFLFMKQMKQLLVHEEPKKLPVKKICDKEFWGLNFTASL